MSDTTEQVPAAPQKNSNTLLIVVIVIIAVLAVAGFAAQKMMQSAGRMVGEKIGENVTETMIENAAGGQADVDVTDDGMTVKTDEGTFSTGTKLTADFPADVPVYPGASVTYSGTNTGEGAGTGAVFSTTDEYTKVADFYADKLVSEGWIITSTQNITNSTVMSATKGNRSLGLAASTEDGVTTITLGVNEENE